MPINDFIGFASSGNANIVSQADYAAAAEQSIGMQPGPASSALANKVWRQGANMAAAIAAAVADLGYDVLDNGDIASLKNKIKSSFLMSQGGLSAFISNYLPSEYTVLNYNSVSVPDNTMTNLGEFTLSRIGVYLIHASVNFDTNASGKRRMVISAQPAGVQRNRFLNTIFAPVNDDHTWMQQAYVHNNVTVNDVYYLNVLQTSGSALATEGGIRFYYLGQV